ncbi:DUF4396 domain-containing protein [Amnibacterium sp.]|uniref:DUF4396 domain-containing protein n=1 Tax=Amnibacterium sp. TaxID=1872496 RepID=UPI003F7C4CA0
MPAPWLVTVAWIALALGIGSALLIAVDVFVRGYRLKMPIMNAVWPITGLYFGPAAVWGYLRFGRPTSRKWLTLHGLDDPPSKPGWATIAVGVSHCGAGCTLGDIGAEFTVAALGLSVAGTALPFEYVGDYIAAVALGLLFQFFAIAPMRGLGVRDGIKAAAKADILSLSAFEVGLFGWMALMAFVFFPDPHLTPASPVYWFLMQIGMIIGFGTAWPANVWLIKRGVKEAM